jgi:acyl-CoA thioester hydrolase
VTGHRVRVRARYPETDRMGVVHHSHYFVWFEIGRTELLRDLGMPYAALEEEHLYMPVIEAAARYRAPVRYDEEVDVETELTEVTGVQVRFGYRLLRHPGGERVATGFSLHAAVNEKGRPRRLPQDVRERLASLVVAEDNQA